MHCLYYCNLCCNSETAASPIPIPMMSLKGPAKIFLTNHFDCHKNRLNSESFVLLLQQPIEKKHVTDRRISKGRYL
jgi:hypothetical protein